MLKTGFVKFWKARAISSRAGRRHKTLDRCDHRHRSDAAARVCGERMKKLRPDARRWWTTAEIWMVPVGARLPNGRIVR